MDVNCEGCAGCCLDWRPVAPAALDHERRGSRQPLDDTYNLVPLLRDEVRAFLDAGYGDAMTPRLWRAEEGSDDQTLTIDGYDVVALDGRPVFFVGLRKPPKPVGPFGLDQRWLATCVFLDPENLRCRIHEDDLYPETCARYPGENLVLGRETECERVEAAYGGDRLLDATPPEGIGPRLTPAAVGAKLFVHPDPDRLTGVVGRVAAGSPTAADRAEFVGVAVGSRAGSTEVDAVRAERARTRALTADSWAGGVVETWADRAGELGGDATDASYDDVEERRGAPETTDWK